MENKLRGLRNRKKNFPVATLRSDLLVRALPTTIVILCVGVGSAAVVERWQLLNS